MPSMEEQLALIRWVETLPAREGAKNYQEVLGLCASRYGSTPAGLSTVIDHQVEVYRRTVKNSMVNARKSLEEGEIPSNELIAETIEKALRAGLLRMWTYANEYYQRWTLPTMETDESDFDSFLKGLTEGE